LFLGTAAAAAVLAVGSPGVRLVFQWGAFSTADSATVAQLLAVYAVAIPAWGLHQVIARSFYAERRMWPPVLIGTGAAAMAVVLSMVMVAAWDAGGLVWASVLSMGAYAVTLTLYWVRGRGAEGNRLAMSLGRSVAAGVVAAGAGWWMARLFSDDAAWSIAEALGGFVAGGATVALVFAAVSWWLGSREVRSLWAGWRA